MSLLPLPLRFLLREWRAGEIRVVLLAVALAVASLTAVAFLGDRVDQALGREANALLAADLAVASDHPLPAAYAEEARRLGLTVSSSAAFLSMALAGEHHLLVGLKAAAPGYPLRGELRVAQQAYAAGQPTRALPGPGQAWLDSRAATGLGVQIGEYVELGAASFQVTALITFEAERSGNFLALAPRVLIAAGELEKTGLVQEGSRVRYRLLVAGGAEQQANHQADLLAAWRAWVEPRLARGEKLEDVRDARPELRQILDRAQRYLGLAAVLTVVLAAAATQMALRRYVQRHYDQFALLRCFGASRRRLLGLYLGQLAGMGALAGLFGASLGWATQQALAGLLGEVIRLGLPPPSLQPMLLGVIAGVVLLLAFALPPLLRLARVPSLRVLRRDLGPAPGSAWVAQITGLILIAGLIVWQAGELRLAGIVGAGVIGVMLLAAALIHALLWPLGKLARHLPPGPRLGLIGLKQRRGETTLQAMALSLGLLALLLLTLVRSDLLDAWKNQIPPGSPNRFIINIQPEQVAGVEDWLQRHGIRDATLYPMIRGRLTHIEGRTVRPEDTLEGRARRLAEREFNLSELAHLPPANELTAGQWWQPGQQDGFTVEQGIADTLGIHLGERLEFDVGGLPLAGRVTSLRRVEWDSFRVNFFVATPVGAMSHLPRSYITSFYLPRERGTELAELVTRIPNLTVIDVAQVIDELSAMTDRVAHAVQLVFVFSLGVGVLVMLAALYARRNDRAAEIGLWRTLGASKNTLRLGLASEFAVLGLLAGSIAAAAASVLAWVLARQVFDLPHQPDPLIWLFGIGGGMVLVVSAGWLASRDLIEAPPLKALRMG